LKKLEAGSQIDSWLPLEEGKDGEIHVNVVYRMLEDDEKDNIEVVFADGEPPFLLLCETQPRFLRSLSHRRNRGRESKTKGRDLLASERIGLSSYKLATSSRSQELSQGKSRAGIRVNASFFVATTFFFLAFDSHCFGFSFFPLFWRIAVMVTEDTTAATTSTS
jgi:hypothetical protein